MLSTTLSIITLSAEHKKYRNDIARMLQRIQTAWYEQQRINQQELSSLLLELSRFHSACHERIVERCLIPTLRVASSLADGLIAQLDMISDTSEAILKSLKQFSSPSGNQSMEEEVAPDIHTAMETYCVQMQKRFDLEEKELLPLTLHVLTKEEDWFSIATQLLKKADTNHQSPPVTTSYLPPMPSYSSDREMMKM